MISLEHIHSLTDFRRNASNYVDRVRHTKTPLVLTVNGEAAVVIQDALVFQNMLNRMEEMQEELRVMKLEALQHQVAVGINQLENGQYAEYDEETLPDFFEDIKARGRQRLTQRGEE